MKRSKLFLLSLFSLMLSGTAWAQDSSSTEDTETTTTTVKASNSVDSPENVYTISSHNESSSGYTMYWDAAGGNDEESCAATFAFYAGTNDGEYYIYCVDNKTYLSYETSATADKEQTKSVANKNEAKCWKISTVTFDKDNVEYVQFQTIGTSATLYANWNGGVNADKKPHSCMGFWTDSGSSDAGSGWTLHKLTETPKRVNITYNVVATFTEGGSTATMLSKVISVKEGSSYPIYKIKYSIKNAGIENVTVNSDFELPTGTVSADETKEINVKASQNVPYFTVSSSCDNATWYALSLSASKLKLNYVENVDKMSLTSSTTNWEDKDLFCFVGNVITGFKIYNKAAGKNMLLSSSKTMSTSTELYSQESEGGATYVIMTDETTAKSQSYLWDVTKSSNKSGFAGFYLGQHGVSSARMNLRSSALAYWTGGADDGSTFTVEAVNVDDATLATIKDLYDKNGQLGYPNANVTATTELGSAISGLQEGDQTTSQTLRQKYAAYTSCTDVAVPESGKFYTLLCTSGKRYVLSTLSKNESYNTRLATSAEGAASTADCIFYYKDGKYMMGYNDGYFVGETTANNPFAGHAVAGSTTGSIFSFSSANVSDGSLYVNFQNGSRKLNANDDGYTNAGGSSATGNGYCFKVAEVTELPLTIGSNGWSSFSAPVDVKIPTGVTVYYAKDEPTNGKLLLTELTGGIIPANTGVLVQGEEATTVNFSTETGDASATDLSDNKLVSNWYVNTIGNSTEETAKADGLYAFATKTNSETKEKTTGFMKLLTAISLPGHKCYLNTATSASTGSAQFIPIALTDDPTGIESAETTTDSDINAPIYDLQGRKVNGTKKGGMYIQNGKVFIAM